MDGYLFIGYTLSRTVVPPDSPDKHPFFLVDQAEHPADLLTHPVRILTDFWIDQLGVDLRGDDGLVPEDFLQGFKRHALAQDQGRRGMTCNMRADADTAADLLADTFQTVLHTPYFPHREHPVRRNLEFVHPLYFSISSAAIGSSLTT